MQKKTKHYYKIWHINKILFISALCLSIYFCIITKAQAESWAIYLYLCGSDLESNNGAATADIQEILDAKLPDSVKVVIQTGGSRKWQNDTIPSNKIARYLIQNGDMEELGKLPNANMGNAEALRNFIQYCETNHPADKKMLILWDHGSGSAGPLMHDELFNGQMNIADIRKALETVHGKKPATVPYEIIGFDACLMATIDVANIVLGFSKYLVASQHLEPGNGWEYTGWLNALGKNTKMNGAELGKTICDTFLKGCKEAETDDSATLSVIDLSKISQLNLIWNALGLEALQQLIDNDDFFATFSRSARSAENFHNSKSEGYSNMVDMGDCMARLKQYFPEIYEDFNKTLTEAVVYKVNGRYVKSTGLSFYHPMDGRNEAFKTMLKVSNVSSFLLMQGLMLGAIDENTAIKRIEAIINELEQAFTEDNNHNKPQTNNTQILPSQQAKPEKPEQTKPEQNKPESSDSSLGDIANIISQIPQSEPQNSLTDIAQLIDQTSLVQSLANIANQVTQVALVQHIKPLDKLDISNLENTPITITGNGEVKMELGPEKIKYLDNVRFYLTYLDKDEDLILYLGNHGDVKSDWKKGVFKHKFKNRWASLDGHYVFLDISQIFEDSYRYAVHIKHNKNDAILEVVYDVKKSNYTILGVRRLLENGMPDKMLIPLKEGDTISTILLAEKLSTAGENPQETEVDTFKIGKKAVFEDIDLGDGQFAFTYEMADIQGNSVFSDLIFIKVKDGEIEFLN